MSKCRVRLVLWLVMTGTAIGGGIFADLLLRTLSQPPQGMEEDSA